ncbi:MAG: amidohydrolase family protein [Bacteroidetes bacterium]|nr:amidohydrolase family protein [Bacteroidota bacterium]
MKLFSAQYVITCSGPPLVRPLIETAGDGTVISVTDTGGNLPERSSLAYYNGIIVPGFVNCHCHLELSHYRNRIGVGTGLTNFIGAIRRLRENEPAGAVEEAVKYDSLMAATGVVACADICNGTGSFRAKESSSIEYVSLIEVFGINPESAGRRYGEALAVAREALHRQLRHNMTPHSAYSMSLPLMKMVSEYPHGDPVSSIHFMESESEKALLQWHEGDLFEYYRGSGINEDNLVLPESHSDAILNHTSAEGNLILVHNTFADASTVREVNKRGNTWWCLCAGSNLYITGKMPPVRMLRDEQCNIVVGTDSLASNSTLSITNELRILQDAFPELSLEELVKWACLNGARALGMDSWAGSIEPGKRPGLVLIEGADLAGKRLLPGSKAKRVI